MRPLLCKYMVLHRERKLQYSIDDKWQVVITYDIYQKWMHKKIGAPRLRGEMSTCSTSRQEQKGSSHRDSGDRREVAHALCLPWWVRALNSDKASPGLRSSVTWCRCERHRAEAPLTPMIYTDTGDRCHLLCSVTFDPHLQMRWAPVPDHGDSHRWGLILFPSTYWLFTFSFSLLDMSQDSFTGQDVLQITFQFLILSAWWAKFQEFIKIQSNPIQSNQIWSVLSMMTQASMEQQQLSIHTET